MTQTKNRRRRVGAASSLTNPFANKDALPQTIPGIPIAHPTKMSEKQKELAGEFRTALDDVMDRSFAAIVVLKERHREGEQEYDIDEFSEPFLTDDTYAEAMDRLQELVNIRFIEITAKFLCLPPEKIEHMVDLALTSAFGEQ